MKTTKRRRKRKPRSKIHYWYRRFVGECPVCGRNAGYRVRVEGHRPTGEPRVILLNDFQTYDGCMERG